MSDEPRDDDTHDDVPLKVSGLEATLAVEQTLPLDETIPATPKATSSHPPPKAHGRGDALGRYVVLDLLGEGAMGAVYAAYDPELDRRVALKVLHPTTVSSKARSQGKGRLVREAQAMAKLNHPNVIQVFDVGLLEDTDVYIAMEYVEGSSLGDWLSAEERSWEEILEVFRQAARGLAHAHAHGVVHRDFKPDNCLVDTEDRVRVIDFGIARQSSSIDEDELERSSEGATAKLADLAKTHAGMLIGTPAYMAFEQLEGRAADARSDQFAFAVSLYEALYRTAPFVGDKLLERMVEILEGRIRPVPKDSEVPGWVESVVRRALSTAPDDRHASMEAMLALLEPPAERKRSGRWLALGVGAVVVAVAATLAIDRLGAPPPEPALCTGLEGNLDGVWDEARRAALREAFAGSEASYAEAILERTISTVDRRAADWVEMRADACEDTRIRGEVSEPTMDLRMACLDRRLTELDTTLGVLSEAGAGAVDRAVQLVSDLPSLERCADVDRLEADAAHEPPPALRERVSSARHTAIRVRALGESGAYDDAAELSEQLLIDARDIGWDPIVAEALQHRARALVWRGEFVESRDLLFEAAWRADRAGDAWVEARVWIELVFVVGSKLREREAGLRWAGFARAALEQTGDDPVLAWRLDYNVGLLQGALGHLEEALETLTAAESHQHEAMEEGNWRFAITHGAQASVLSRLGRSEEAIAAYRGAREEMRVALGPDHPANGPLLNNLATAFRRAQRLDEARQTLEEALELKRRTLGSEHPSVALTVASLGGVEQRLGHYDRAAELYREAREVRARTLGESHSLYTSVMFAEASLALARGESERAIELSERALRRHEARGESLPIARARSALGFALYRAGRYREAQPLLRRALTHYEAEAVAADATAYPRTRLGAVLVELGRPDEAIELLRPALEARTDGDVDAEALGLTRYALGRALFESGRDASRGWRLVGASRRDFERAGPPGRWALPRVDGWLSEHERPRALE